MFVVKFGGCKEFIKWYVIKKCKWVVFDEWEYVEVWSLGW